MMLKYVTPLLLLAQPQSSIMQAHDQGRSFYRLVTDRPLDYVDYVRVGRSKSGKPGVWFYHAKGRSVESWRADARDGRIDQPISMSYYCLREDSGVYQCYSRNQAYQHCPGRWFADHQARFTISGARGDKLKRYSVTGKCRVNYWIDTKRCVISTCLNRWPKANRYYTTNINM